MDHLSKNTLASIGGVASKIPEPFVFDLPEKILQFGTGVLLRALPDYFVDKANKRGVFNGRIVIVKSTQTGDTEAFKQQDCLYTITVRGIEDGSVVEEHIISAAISRVLTAGHQWAEILACAANPQMEIIISNTTEVGIQLVNESIFDHPPTSFPGKLLAFLYERYTVFDGAATSGMTVIPTELLTDNGTKLKTILLDLAAFNQLDAAFVRWLNDANRFCSSLVDRIVPGKPEPDVKQGLEKTLGYTDDLMLVCEPYRLWAIEGDEQVRKTLSFCSEDSGVVITPDIIKFKELKLRMLNATHTLSSGLAYLSGFQTVKSAMEDELFFSYIRNLMMDEIRWSIPHAIPDNEITEFGTRVLDRFRNPFLEHQWLNITMQYSSKMQSRVLPLLIRYYERFRKPPELIAMGFAAYLLFMRPVKKEGTLYSGILENQYYPIRDDQASEFDLLWQEDTVEHVVYRLLAYEKLWSADLNTLDGFTGEVTRQLKGFIRSGTMAGISSYSGKTD